MEIDYMPILSCDRRLPNCPKQIPMHLLNNERAKANHGQDLQKLKSRGGLGTHEALAIMNNKSYREYGHLSMDESIAELNKQIIDRLQATEGKQEGGEDE